MLRAPHVLRFGQCTVIRGTWKDFRYPIRIFLPDQGVSWRFPGLSAGVAVPRKFLPVLF
jgi:hypothetical protein